MAVRVSREREDFMSKNRTTRAKRSVLATVVCVLLLSACADSEKKTSGDPLRTGNAGIDELVSAYCGTVRSCCFAAGFPTGQLGDCERVFSNLEEFREVLAGTGTFASPSALNASPGSRHSASAGATRLRERGLRGAQTHR
jgi:hypothetical protein